LVDPHPGVILAAPAVLQCFRQPGFFVFYFDVPFAIICLSDDVLFYLEPQLLALIVLRIPGHNGLWKPFPTNYDPARG
jgi:hypothetical protein